MIPSVNHGKGITMLRSIGSVTLMALFMVGCGEGGGGGAPSTSVTPPPPPDGYTLGVTVSGLAGSGLALAICTPVAHPTRGQPVSTCDSGLQVSANGATVMHSAHQAPGDDYVAILQQPSSPAQHCVIVNAGLEVTVQSLGGTGLKVSCLGEYVYVASAGDNTLSSYRVDVATGSLGAVGPPIATGVSPRAVVCFESLDGATPEGFVYVANEGSNDISAYVVDIATGALTAVPGSPFPAGTRPQALTLYGSLLFVANTGSDNVSAYGIDLSTGVLIPQPGSPLAVGKGPTSIVADANTGIAFVANHGGSNDISAFHFFDLTPAAGSPFPAGGNPFGLALGFWQGGSFLYTSNPDATNPGISGFSVDVTTGATSPLTGSPFSLPVSHYIATETPGSGLNSYLYVTSGDGIVGYDSNVATGALTALPGFPLATGTNAWSITIDPYNQFLYVANDGAATISGFRLDSSTGALSPVAGSPFPAGNHPQSIAMF